MFRSVMTTLVALSLALGCAPKVDFEAVCTRALEPELPPEATTVQWSNLEVETLYRFVEVRGQLELTGRLPTFDDSMPDVTVSSYFACQIDENHVILTRSDEPIRSFASRLEEGEDLYFERALGQGTAISGPAPLVTQQQVDCAVSTDEAVSIAFRNSFKMLHPAKDEAPDFDKVAEGAFFPSPRACQDRHLSVHWRGPESHDGRRGGVLGRPDRASEKSRRARGAQCRHLRNDKPTRRLGQSSPSRRRRSGRLR